jgi:hypothetical protein
MRGVILTQEQADLLGGKLCYSKGVYWIFDRDINDNFIAKEEQIQYADMPGQEWVKELPIVNYEPKIFD